MKRSTPWIFAAVLVGGIARTTFSAEFSETEFRFRLPQIETYRLETNINAARGHSPQWLRAYSNRSTNEVELGSRVVVQIKSGSDIKALTSRTSLTLARTVNSNTFILQAPDAVTAAREAERLAGDSNVLASYPVLRRHGNLHGPYAASPNDFYYLAQWPLEHRVDGNPVGPDINVRSAWPYTMGEGVSVAVADTGIELDHQELKAAVSNAVHHNFFFGNTNGMPVNRSSVGAHGTEVAGLIAAGLNDHRIVGVAPRVTLASWVIFDANGFLASDEQLFDMYQYEGGAVDVQNHSWGGGNGAFGQVGPTALEKLGIGNAAQYGRGGLGSIVVRSGGNDRQLPARADDDAYPADPHVIAVAAVNVAGKVASYSEPGACLLVAAPSGDPGSSVPGIFSTDLLGTDGANGTSFCPSLFPDCSNKDLSDYVFNSGGTGGFAGTSASAPHISGLAALMLSVNPALGYRDVQQILVLSSRHFDLNDPDLCTNGAGFLVSHNDGFGIPDAGQAVQLARGWANRPALETVALTNEIRLEIPDDALRVEVSGDGVPAQLHSIRCLPSLGVHADEPTPMLEMVEIGLAGTVPAMNLTNKGALILRGDFDFSVKIANAAAAGAAFAVIYNYSTNVIADQGGDQLTSMAQTDASPIPAVFIGHSDGAALKTLIETNMDARVRIRLQSAEKIIQVSDTLVCEHVGVRVKTDHARRGDLRITLTSPQGTRSVLQAYNLDQNPGPADWTYWSTHHFFECSAGDWRIAFTDEAAGATGAVESVSLILRGAAISDSDADGLDDAWETTHFESLAYGPKDDPDGDGASNAREQVAGTHPNGRDSPFAIDFTWYELAGIRRHRLTWPGAAHYAYDIFSGTNLQTLTFVTNVPGRFPETEWLTPYSTAARERFFRVYSRPAP